MLLLGMGLGDDSLQLMVAGVFGIVLGCAVGGYRDNWVWTGIGPFTHPKTKQEEFERGKTLWDVLQLLVVPAILSLGVVWFNDRQTAADRANAQVSAWNNLLDGYLSQVSDLMLKHNLGPHATKSLSQNQA